MVAAYARKVAFGLAPVVLAAVLVILFLTGGIPGVSRGDVPPIEELAVDRIVLSPGRIDLSLINDGPDMVQVSQVMVNGAYWQFSMNPAGPLKRLRHATIGVEYPWIEGDPQFITVVTSTGVTFHVEIEVAAESPSGRGYLGSLALLGFYIGVIPVLLGLLWLPFLKVVRESWYGFFLSLTVGLLVFLGVDTLAEAIETMGSTPASMKGVGILLGGIALAYLGLEAVGRGQVKSGDKGGRSHWYLAFSISFGIGIHNLGEGLAVGSAYAVGNISLGALLVVGFMLHNVTEGLAVVAPVARHAPKIRRLLLLGLLAGTPAIAGAWIGGFAYSSALALLFLGIGAGAIFQVTVAIGRYMLRDRAGGGLTIIELVGTLVGIGIMYGTSLLVTA